MRKVNKQNIVFMGTPEFAVNTLAELNKHHNIKLVITQPDKINNRGKKIVFSPVKQFAIDNNITLIQPNDVNDESIVEKLKNIEIDYIVVVAYGQIINKDIRKLAKKNIINVHGSLLPKYRGAAPIQRAIMDREKETGITIMRVEKGLDKGLMYLKSKTLVDNKKYPSLHDELSELGAKLTIEYISNNEIEELVGESQNEDLASYAQKIDKNSGIMDFKDVQVEIGKINGLYPKPGASFLYNDERVKVLDGEIYSLNKKDCIEKGTIIDVLEDGILINCDNGIIKVKEIQFPGKKAMLVSNYLKGNSIEKGKKLG